MDEHMNTSETGTGRENVGKSLLAIVLVIVIGVGGYYGGLSAGKKQAQTIVVEGVANTSSSVAGTTDFATFWQVWNLINENYLRDDTVAGQDKVYGAVKGLVAALNDPYSEFFTPVESKQFLEDVQGNFSGIGAEIGIRKNQLVIVSPLKGSPAEQAGLKPADQIFAINASSTEGITIEKAVQQIRGAEGTTVKLTVYREGWDKPSEIEIKRQRIEVPTLTYTIKESNIAYIELNSFNANAPQLFTDAAIKLMNDGAKGIVLDLRNNPGGYLDVAVELAGWFIPKGGVVVREESRIQDPATLTANGNGALGQFPVAVLINGGSASASEILAGALRDNKKATIVGEQSFGKGVVQQILPLGNGSSVKLTIARWLLPNGESLDNGGLKPDVEIKLTEEDFNAERDPQLDKAIEIVRSKIR